MFAAELQRFNFSLSIFRSFLLQVQGPSKALMAQEVERKERSRPGFNSTTSPPLAQWTLTVGCCCRTYPLVPSTRRQERLSLLLYASSSSSSSSPSLLLSSLPL